MDDDNRDMELWFKGLDNDSRLHLKDLFQKKWDELENGVFKKAIKQYKKEIKMIDTFKKDYGMSDIKVAHLLGITRQAVWQYRTNKRPIPKTIFNLLLLLKIQKNRELLCK